MRIFTPLLCLALMAINQLSAEGTRQLAPNGSIDINGNTTTDLAALHINNPAYNSFASYTNPNPQSRLYIHVIDPSKECIYLGFSWAHNNQTPPPDPPRINFEYRIKDPNGNIVFGPITVTGAGANIQTWATGFAGPTQITGPGGYNATQVTSLDLASQGWSGKGDYYIEFQDIENNDFLIDFWDITVADCSNATPAEKRGRVWSYNWSIFAINDFGFPNRPFNGAFYVCAPDPDNTNASFVTRIDFNGSGFRPAAFNIAFNSFGIQNTGNVSEDRKSVELVNATQPEYSIFLNDPVDICETAEVGDIAILGLSRCNGEEFCIKFTTSKAGLIDLLLDFDGGDNIYTPGTADVILAHLVTADEVGVPTCITWNGLDGLGNPLFEDVGTQIPITIAYAQGIYHFPIYDAELMTNGFQIQAIRPAASIPFLFYDDSNISVTSGSGEPSTQLAGCVTPCHRWTNYTQPNTPGFGNLNTINSWWFSQQIISQDVFFLPAYYACEIEGPSHFCQGGTSQLTSKPLTFPTGAKGGEIINTKWFGPGIIGSTTESSITVGAAGLYLVRIQWLTNLGDTCETACEYAVTMDPPLTATIDTLIVQGQTIEINGETYNQGGQYIQELTTAAGCDSVLTINVIVLHTVIHYDLEACESFMSNGSHMDYTEFIPSYPEPLPCATIIADTLYRNNPAMNKHSCTPGVNNSTAMCVSSLEGCTYIPGHDASVIIEVNIIPDSDTAVHLTGFSFYEKAPTTYSWISGDTGPNNYPTWFRVRVLKNGVEIFLSPATATSLTWQERVFDFLDNDEFLVKDPTIFRFELLPYCPVGNGAIVSAWDLDEISIVASCASADGLNKDIGGVVITQKGAVLPGMEVHMFDFPTFENQVITTTDENGRYIFENVVPDNNYIVRGYKNTGFRNGVSTLDLVLIQKHLLGIEPFTTAYEMIAADANKSNTVSVIDLLELRKLILGIYNELPDNTSWRFGITGQELELDEPWLFKEYYILNDLDDHHTDLDFIGIKIGDINGTAQAGLNSVVWKVRGNEKLLLQIRDQPVKADALVKVDITARQFTEIFGMQFALEIAGGQIREVVNGALQMSEENFTFSKEGMFRMSWTTVEPLSVSSDDALFSLMIDPDRNGLLSDLLRINPEILNPEAYASEDLNVMEVDMEINTPGNAVVQNILFQNEPNPFSQSTTIRFQLEKSAHATFRIFDLSGRMVLERTADFDKGMNTIEITKSEIGIDNGVVVCQLQADGFVVTQKMVIVK